MLKSDPPSISNSHFVSLHSNQGGRESVKLQPHASSVLCLFQFSELKCFPHSPTPCTYSLIHLPPSCWANVLVLNLPPMHNLSFFPPSVNHTCILHPLPHLLLLLLSFPLSLFYIYPPLRYTFITRSVLFLLHHIPTSLASTFPFFSSGKSNSTPQLPLSSLQYCGKRGKNLQIKQTNQSSGNSLFVPEIKITG